MRVTLFRLKLHSLDEIYTIFLFFSSSSSFPFAFSSSSFFLLLFLLSPHPPSPLPQLVAAAAVVVQDLAATTIKPSTLEALLRSPPMVPGIILHRSRDRSLDARFLPRHAIRTRAIAVCDDDVSLSPRALSFALACSRSRFCPTLVGFFGRAQNLDPASCDHYSILLAKFLFLLAPLLSRYNCAPELAPARRVVDHACNYEDILMSFVASMDGAELVLVEGNEVRNWGNPRNRPRCRQKGRAAAAGA